MTYQVLARKWRPRDFASLVGQEHVVRALTHALDGARLHHAYLFTGTRGVGKTTLSRIFAKALNCETGITATPCGVCRACREIDEGRFVDYVEMDAASNRGVDEMAALLERAVYAPVDARFKVYMIDEVHMLTNHAFNAMLKTLEEPPPHIKFILATTDPQKIPVTVLSRCLQFNLKQMPAGHIVGHLEKILAAEQIAFEPQALRLLARAAEGSMRDALSLTDQAIAYSANQVTEEAVRGMLGALDQSYLIRLLDAIVAGDGALVLSVADEMALRSLSFSVALQDLASLLHRVAWAQFAPASVLDEWPDAADLRRFAQALAPEQVQLFYQIATLGRAELGLAPDEYAGFTMTLLRMLAFEPALPPGSGAGPSSKSAGGSPAGPGRRAAVTAQANAAGTGAPAARAMPPVPDIRASAHSLPEPSAARAPAATNPDPAASRDTGERPAAPAQHSERSEHAANAGVQTRPAQAAVPPADDAFPGGRTVTPSGADDRGPLDAAPGIEAQQRSESAREATQSEANDVEPSNEQGTREATQAEATGIEPPDAQRPREAQAQAQAQAADIELPSAQGPREAMPQAQAADIELPSAQDPREAMRQAQATVIEPQRTEGPREGPREAATHVAPSLAAAAPQAAPPLDDQTRTRGGGGGASAALDVLRNAGLRVSTDRGKTAAKPAGVAPAKSAAPRAPVVMPTPRPRRVEAQPPQAPAQPSASASAPAPAPWDDMPPMGDYPPPSSEDDYFSGMPDDGFTPAFGAGPDDVRFDARFDAPVAPTTPSVDLSKLPPPLALDAIGFAGDWPALASSLGLTGVAHQLAFNSELTELAGDSLSLSVPVPQYADAAQVAKLKTALAEKLGKPLEVRVAVGPARRTAAVLDAAARAERQREAEREIGADPFVQSLIRDFGASIVPGSVRPIAPDAEAGAGAH